MGNQGLNMRSAAQSGRKTLSADDLAAEMLLRSVENFLRDGQPRHAVAHICDVTGVGRAEAEEFVASLKDSLFD
jgi:hypothetical protein